MTCRGVRDPGGRAAHASGSRATARWMAIRWVAMLWVATAPLTACLPPRVGPLHGLPTTEPLPMARLASTPLQTRFQWHYADRLLRAQGEGVVRSLPPDSARLDFFLANGSAGGSALLLGDTLSTGEGVLPTEWLPPVPLLWAAVGRLALPAGAAPVVHRLADTLWGEMAGAPDGSARVHRWRVLFVRGELRQMARVVNQRVVEQVDRERASTGQWVVRYVASRARRQLRLDIQDTLSVERFDDIIWRRP